ncbi:MAG: DNA polymerase III subunit alpha [Paracoccaceae bacterium]
MIDSFIHLRLHSIYSLLEGAVQVKALPKLCEAAGSPAVAITDTNNLFGALEFSETMAKAGVQPIIGCQLDLAYAPPPQPGQRAQAPAPVVALAMSEAGYRNLMALSSAAYLDAGDAPHHVTVEALKAHHEGLILLTGGALGPFGRLVRERREQEANALLLRLSSIFGDRLYVEIQRHGVNGELRTPEEEATERWFIETAYERALPIVATNDVYFPDQDMYEAHDAFLCIGQGAYVNQEARRRLTVEHRFKSVAEMKALFKDLPEAIENTVEIAHRCHWRPGVIAPILPKFADDEVEELRRQAEAGLTARLAVIDAVAPEAEYRQRLEFELGVIEGMGFPGYFLIVADFIKWAKDRKIPVGPGRGSGAGSLVAYALTITDLDPLRYGLLFERFLNPDRVSMPDFDIDFCMDRREEVIAYVQDRYGRDRVAQIITFGGMMSKAAVRDVGRVLQMSYGQVDRISKLIPMEGVKPMSVAKARLEEPRIAEMAAEEYVVGQLLDLSEKVEGLLRNASTHAAGVVIGDRPLVELTPLYQDPRSDMPATQFNMKWVEQAGLVKFDFLGLKTLTVIQGALDFLVARGVEVDISAIPLDDEKSYDLYGSANTVAVFQVESQGMRDALRQLQPTTIEDIVALVALYRPGPMENIPKFCNVKNGREKRTSIHPLIDGILDETQGIIVYQEQVMEIARKMGGYSLGGADLLRRAMGKKIQAAMDEERPKFIEGAAVNGVPKAKAQEVFDLLDKFANYGFNKSHAAAYAVVSYQTAWLKANHPVEFMAAVMNCDMHLTDKLAIYKREADRLGIVVAPPDVNRSGERFRVEEGRILYALGALKNVGAEAMKLITAARADGPFTDLFDFARRVELKRIGKRPMEMLARAGAFEKLEPNRQRAVQSADLLIAYSSASFEAAASAQVSLFGEAGEGLAPPRLPAPDDWAPMEQLSEEFAAVGFYLSGHPLDDYAGPLKRKRVQSYAEIVAGGRSGVSTRIAGSVMVKQERKSARGTRFAFVRLSDPTGVYEVTVFSEVLMAHRDDLEPGRNLVLTVTPEIDGDQVKFLVSACQPIDGAVADAAPAGLKIHVSEPRAFESIRARLADARKGRGGPVNIVLTLPETGREVEIQLPGEFPVTPAIRGAIKAAAGVVHVEEF